MLSMLQNGGTALCQVPANKCVATLFKRMSEYWSRFALHVLCYYHHVCDK